MVSSSTSSLASASLCATTTFANPLKLLNPSTMTKSTPDKLFRISSSLADRFSILATSPGAKDTTSSAPALACAQVSLPALSMVKCFSGMCFTVPTR
ncbi:MAG: hypothetical protein APZ16_05725 [Candidatus Hadarchaeum yellowstonense]|uniref:Uncharacterized protein n=1 Tax=Hadarchaeum yellowstonense TaxID=1776334 RepID=A0A147JX62_HADYE|nr:MAG: hypothetical protein APZ16_05725 [Candidatus Hadarchaeum yellowstonense]